MFTEEGVTVAIEVGCEINSTAVGNLSGKVNEVWRLPNIAGEMRLVQDIINTHHTNAAPLRTQAGAASSKLAVLRRIGS